MTQFPFPPIPDGFFTQEIHMWIITHWNYPLFFDKGMLSLAERIYDPYAQNMRHQEDASWPKGPEAFLRVVKSINGMCGGGLDNLESKILRVWADGDGKVWTLVLQRGIRNKNEITIPALRDLPPGTLFEEIQLHCHYFDPSTHLVVRHEVEYWPTAANGKILSEAA